MKLEQIALFIRNMFSVSCNDGRQGFRFYKSFIHDLKKGLVEQIGLEGRTEDAKCMIGQKDTFSGFIKALFINGSIWWIKLVWWKDRRCQKSSPEAQFITLFIKPDSLLNLNSFILASCLAWGCRTRLPVPCGLDVLSL